jgi:sulfonate transport system substrate-binding protein
MSAKWMKIAVTALAVVTIAACDRTGQNPAGPPEKVIIAISNTADSVLAQVAQARGFYREEGLDATVHLQPYGKLALQEVLEGKADFATVAETPVMFAIMDGARISVIATIESSRKGNAIVARKDRGILALGDLRGKKVALTRGTTSDYFLDAVLSVNGISREEITTVDLKAEEMAAALDKGAVDAVSTFTTYAFPAQRKLGERVITFHDENAYTFTFNLVASQDFIGKNPGKVRKMLRAMVKAEEFVKRNPAEAQKEVSGFSGIDASMLRDIWGDTTFAVSLDQSLILALEDESRWAVKNSLVKGAKAANYLDYIHLDGLKAVKPEAVRILR